MAGTNAWIMLTGTEIAAGPLQGGKQGALTGNIPRSNFRFDSANSKVKERIC